MFDVNRPRRGAGPAAAGRPVCFVVSSRIGLLNASVFSAAILPLSTAYVVCEAFGWEMGVSRSFKDAPIFFGVYTALIVLGAGIILLPIQSLIDAMLSSQTLNGVLLPIILIVMLQLDQRPALDGPLQERARLQLCCLDHGRHRHLADGRAGHRQFLPTSAARVKLKGNRIRALPSKPQSELEKSPVPAILA